MADSIENKEFDSPADVKAFIATYNSAEYTNFVVNSSNSRQMLFKCKHGVERKLNCGGLRPKQHCNFMNCSAYIPLNRWLGNSR